jgi:hypothetical protein
MLFSLLTAALAAQDQTPDQDQPPEHHHMAAPPPGDGWSWTTDANVFVGYNYQQRLFATSPRLNRRTGSCSPAAARSAREA